MSKVLFAGYFCLLLGAAIADVGESFEAGVYTWEGPVIVSILLLTSYILGILTVTED